MSRIHDRLTRQDPHSQLLRFLLVGGSNFIVSFALFHGLLALPASLVPSPFLAQFVSYSAGTVWSFFWNRQFTFRVPGNAIGQASRFVVLQAALALISALSVEVAIERARLSPTIAWFAVMAVVTIANFLLSRDWAFRNPPPVSSNIRLAALVFTIALAARLALLFTVFDNLQHGSAPNYGSAALALHQGFGLTINRVEVQSLSRVQSNVRGDFRNYFKSSERHPLTEFLPGPAILLAGLWELVPIYNFAPYLVVQSVIDSLLIAVFAVLMVRKHRLLALLTVSAMVINLPVIKRTLMMGYDFWPQFAVLVMFLGALALQRRGYRPWLFGLVGLLASIPVWFRDITTPLPVFVAAFLLYELRKRECLTWGASIGRVMLLLTPVLLSVALLSTFRYETTGNFRPTRSTFWHSFMAGVGQFSNPYGVVNNDQSVWEFGKKVNPSLSTYTLSDMYLLPNSPYEITLKEVAGEFVRDYPFLFLRNFAYRIGIMISPPFYTDGDFIPRAVAARIYPVGFALMLLWCIGMLYLRRALPFVFGVTISIYAYFFLAFGWFYVVGRVILPFMFISTMVWIAGGLAVFKWMRTWSQQWTEAR